VASVIQQIHNPKAATRCPCYKGPVRGESGIHSRDTLEWMPMRIRCLWKIQEIHLNEWMKNMATDTRSSSRKCLPVGACDAVCEHQQHHQQQQCCWQVVAMTVAAAAYPWLVGSSGSIIQAVGQCHCVSGGMTLYDSIRRLRRHHEEAEELATDNNKCMTSLAICWHYSWKSHVASWRERGGEGRGRARHRQP